MRVPLLALLVLLSGMALPTSQAGAEPLVKDGEGDTELSLAFEGSPASVPFSAADSATVDIVSFDILEGDTTLDFVLALKSLQRTAGFTSYEMQFAWHDVTYEVYVGASTIPSVQDVVRARLVRYEEDVYYGVVAELDAIVDREKGTITVPVEKVYILDEDEDVPTRGDQLKEVHASARMHLALLRGGGFGEIVDRAPDDSDVAFSFQHGDLSTGHLKAEPEARIRVSNGGSTTFVYRVAVANTGDAEDEVDIAPEDLPEGWNATVQSPVRLDPDEVKVLTVLASVPFGHTHGGFDSFNVTIKSRSDPASMASVRLGVLHTPIPQPAGHHSDLFLHADKPTGIRLGSGSDMYMNTEAAHDNDEAEAFVNGNDGNGLVFWIPLNPRLAMGLDFDMERTGAIAGNLIGRTVGDAEMKAEILYGYHGQWGWGEQEGIVLAEAEKQKVTLDVQKPTAFSLVLTPTEDADYVPFDPEMSLYLKLTLNMPDGRNFCCLDGTMPSLTTADFKMTLPLNEYHDKLRGIAEAAALLDIVADGPVEKAGRPGTTLTYLFTVKNGGSVDTVVDLDLAGGDAGMGTLVPDGAIPLAPKESRKVTLAVAIPANAEEGQEIEVLLFAHAQDDPSKTAIARTKTLVTLGGEAVPDERDVLLAAQDSENESPGFGTLAVLGAGVAVALVAARRRKA